MKGSQLTYSRKRNVQQERFLMVDTSAACIEISRCIASIQQWKLTQALPAQPHHLLQTEAFITKSKAAA